MMLLPIVVAAAAALLCGGSIKNISNCTVRALWAPIAAFAVQLAASALIPSVLPRSFWFPLFVCASYAFAALFAVLNFRPMLFSLPALAGSLCNFAVIAANNFYMPVSDRVLTLAGFEGIPAAKQTAYIIADSSTRLAWLGDIIYLPIPLLEGFASVGDVLLALGAGVLVFTVLRPQRAGRCGSRESGDDAKG